MTATLWYTLLLFAIPVTIVVSSCLPLLLFLKSFRQSVIINLNISLANPLLRVVLLYLLS